MHKFIFVLFLFLCDFSSAMACLYCTPLRGLIRERYYYCKGNVKTIDEVTVETNYNSRGKETSTDTSNIYNIEYFEDKQCRMFQFKSKSQDGYKIYSKLYNKDGKLLSFNVSPSWSLLLKDKAFYLFPNSACENIYDENGILREYRSKEEKKYFDAEGKEELVITYDEDGTLKDSTVYVYDKTTNDTIITTYDKRDSICSQTIKHFNKQGKLISVYKDGVLMKKYTYGKKGLLFEEFLANDFEEEDDDDPLSTSASPKPKTTPTVYQYNYSKDGVTTKYEIVNDVLQTIEKYDAQGNRIYRKLLEDASKMEVKSAYNQDNKLVYEEEERMSGIVDTIKKITRYKPDGSMEREEQWEYKNGELISFYKEYDNKTLTFNEHITLECKERKGGKGKIDYDTLKTVLRTTSAGDTLELTEYDNSKIVHHIENQFNEFGKIVKSISLDLRYDIRSDTTIFEYDKLHNLVAKYTTNKEGVKTSKIIYKYNDSNHLVSSTEDYIIPFMDGDEGIEIKTFDDFGNVIESVTIEKSDGKIESKTVTTTTYTYYDDSDR